MSKWSKTDKKMLEQHTRPIVHMRRQFEAGRFCLVFGTGLTQQVGIPGWNKLNELIAMDDRVTGEQLLGRPTEEKVDEFLQNESRDTIVKLLTGAGPEETITTQKLYEHFKRRRYQREDLQNHNTPKLESDIYREWKDIISEKLYKEALQEEKILDNHSYLENFLEIIRNTPLTITYNFDDVIEMSLKFEKNVKDDDRGYESVTDIRVLPRRANAVIYHPNGYIPRNKMEEKDPEIVLSEQEFANRMIELATGQYNSILHVFSRNTCLFIGLSLRDSILKNLLKQSAMIAPGNYHYYVHHCGGGKKLTVEEQEAIRSTSFETYNLITLFLNDEEISSMGKLISDGYKEKTRNLNDKDIISLEDTIERKGLAFYFYIVGSVGAGKSTCVSQFRNLLTSDEWTEERKPQLAMDWNEIEKMPAEEKKKNKEEIDKWICEQFYDKNRDLISKKVGISVCDRCPLDPVAFTPEKERRKKADRLLKAISPGTDNVVNGHVILLRHDPEQLEIRAKRRHRKYTQESLERMQIDLCKIYKMTGVTIIDCRFISFYNIIKNVARIIHINKYAPAEIHSRLVEIKDGVLDHDQKT